jgi:acyl-CoA thioesterase-1
MMRTTAVALLALALAAGAGCGTRSDAPAPPAATPTAPPAATTGTPPSAAPAAAPSPSTRPRIVALGDSLTAGLGLSTAQAYPALLQARLNDAGLDYEVVNAGVSGDTSAGGLERLDWALQGNVKILIVALGGNDALRGLPADALKANLSHIIERAQARNVRVVLAGMEAPPNYGRDYIVSFHRVYPELAARYKVAFVPFLLQNVAGLTDLNQSDGIHPTPAGARIVADNVWTVLKPLAEDAH